MIGLLVLCFVNALTNWFPFEPWKVINWTDLNFIIKCSWVVLQPETRGHNHRSSHSSLGHDVLALHWTGWFICGQSALFYNKTGLQGKALQFLPALYWTLPYLLSKSFNWMPAQQPLSAMPMVPWQKFTLGSVRDGRKEFRDEARVPWLTLQSSQESTRCVITGMTHDWMIILLFNSNPNMCVRGFKDKSF